MISEDKDIYYFNGDDSYLAFQTMRGGNPNLRTTSVNVETASEEGLIVFYAEGSEVVSCWKQLELRQLCLSICLLIWLKSILNDKQGPW